MKEALSGTLLAVFISIFSFAPLEKKETVAETKIIRPQTTEELIKRTDLYSKVSKIEVKIDSFELKIARLENAKQINKDTNR